MKRKALKGKPTKVKDVKGKDTQVKNVQAKDAQVKVLQVNDAQVKVTKGKVDILSQPYDNEHFVVFFMKDGRDIGMHFAVCGFDEEMDDLLFDCIIEKVGGKLGFIFNNSTPMSIIKCTVDRFIMMYHFDNL